MPELLKSYIVRPAEQLTPKQVNTIAIQSHPNQLQSKRFLRWGELSNTDLFEELELEMKSFVHGSDVITSLDYIPEVYKKPLQFAHHNGFNFSLDEFKTQLDLKLICEDIKLLNEKNSNNKESIFLKIYSNFADQLIGEAVIKDFEIKSKLDYQAILKTLHIIDKIVHLKEEKSVLNIEQLYIKPILYPNFLTEIDRCRGIKNVVAVEPKENKTETTPKTDSKEPDCGCGKTVEKGPCECTCDDTCVEQNPCCAKIVPYIADLFVVREEVRCYEAGEMSYIENVLESEIRERTQRNLEREEINIEHEEETTSFEQREHSVDDKFSLQKEIDKAIETTLSLDAGVTAHQKWGTGDVTATTNVGYNQSKKEAQKTTQDNAKQIIDKSITSLQKKVRDFTSRKITKEIEEINKHTFGGLTGATKDMSRQFYYVNQVKRAQVFNYGKREMLDFYLPEPSELYKRLIEKKFTKKKPVKPCITISEISPEKYTYYAKCLGMKDVDQIPNPPKTHIKKEVILKKNQRVKDSQDFLLHWRSLGRGTDNGPQTISIEDGYVLDSMQANLNEGNVFTSLHNGDQQIYITLGGKSLCYGTSISTVGQVDLPPLEGNQEITVFYNELKYYEVKVEINYKLKDEILLKWQLPIYYKIMEAYEKELAEYNEALAEFERTKEKAYRQNPFILLQDIQEQLKQAAISYISCQFFDDMNAMKQNVAPCGLPQFDIQEAKKEGEFVRFFEQAFEWKFMNFIFYPYFWSRKCTWENKMNEEADNMLFQRFLKAGFARISVSVRQGFEGHVNYYLATRKIYKGIGIPGVIGDGFLPIFQEIKEDKDNFNTEREGLVKVTSGSNEITLTGTDYYWQYPHAAVPALLGPPPTPAIPAILAGVDGSKVNTDLYREIFIDCIPYKIMNVKEVAADTTHKTWTIKLDKPYHGVSNIIGLPWSTGAVFVGAPWEFKVPTKLVWLREKGGALPTEYPIL